MLLISSLLIIRILSDPQPVAKIFHIIHGTLLNIYQRFYPGFSVHIIAPLLAPRSVTSAKLWIVLSLPVEHEYGFAHIFLTVCKEILSLTVGIATICIVECPQKFSRFHRLVTVLCKKSVLVVRALRRFHYHKVTRHLGYIYSILPC